MTEAAVERLLASNGERLRRLARASAQKDEKTLLAESVELATAIVDASTGGFGKVGLAATKVARHLSSDGRFRAALEATERRDRSEEALRDAMTIAFEIVRSATDDLRERLDQVKDGTDEVKDIAIDVGDQMTEHGAILRRIDENTRRKPERVEGAMAPPSPELPARAEDRVGRGYDRSRALGRRLERFLAKHLPRGEGARRNRVVAAFGRDRPDLELNGSPQDVALELRVKHFPDQGRQAREGLADLIEELTATSISDPEEAEAGRRLRDEVLSFVPSPMTVDRAGEDLDPGELRVRTAAAIREGAAVPHVTPAAVQEALQVPSQSLDDYPHSCLAELSLRPAMDDRFVDLSLVSDLRANATGLPERWHVDRARYPSLQAALDAHSDEELVLVGAPGSGKSTVAAHLALDLARAAIEGGTGAGAPLPFFLSLRDFDPKLGPDRWLAERWSERMLGLDLEAALEARPFLLLLDGLNEMPRDEQGSLNPGLEGWRAWLGRFCERQKGRHRVVFTCRTRDLSAGLSTDVRRVRIVELEPLEPDRVRAFLHEHAGEEADAIAQALEKDEKLAALYRTPLSLTKLLDLRQMFGGIPPTLTALSTAHLAFTLSREMDHTPHFRATGLVSERDGATLAHRPWDPESPYELPDEGPLFRGLAALAYAFQRERVDGGQAHVALKVHQARALYGELAVAGEVAFDTLERGGVDLGVLGSDPRRVEFVLQPMQEYLAARWWAEHPDVDLVRPPWTDALRDLRSVVAGLEEDEPLPEPPTTGWEETVLMAAEMLDDDDRAMNALSGVHPALAGHACAQRRRALEAARVEPSPAEAVRRQNLQTTLLTRSRDPQVDLRDRIEAGRALGVLGHPDRVRREGPHGPYVPPDLVPIPGGTFTLGSDASDQPDEKPEQDLAIADFELGRSPVTRAEYACFVEAKGYDDERWWRGEDAWAWFEGRTVGEGEKSALRGMRKLLQQNPQRLEAPDVTPPMRDYWRAHLERSDAEFEAWLDANIEGGKQHQPWGWTQARFQNPALPVVGVCFYEANAYLAWLSAQTGRDYSLPFERAWERASRGLVPSRPFPFAGEALDPLVHANVYETHLRGLSPVGVFPAGDSPDGCTDLAGLVWEWTASPWTERHDANPSDPDLLVVRGGSWHDPMNDARAAFRYRLPRDLQYVALGFRVCFSPPRADP